MWGATHQEAVEDYVMETMGVYFSTTRPDMKPGHNMCVCLAALDLPCPTYCILCALQLPIGNDAKVE
jgi:hypothetical protein